MIREEDIQNFLWDKGDEWVDLIDDAELPERCSFAEDLADVSVDKLLLNRMADRLEELFERIRIVKLFGIEVRLEREQEASTRVDLLGATPGDPGLVIVEIKKSKQTEREAFTELLGYSQFFSDLLPSLCREDLFLVLIAPMESRIVRDAYIRSLVFEEKPIVALQPIVPSSGKVEDLRLRPWIPGANAIRRLSRAAFSPDNFDVCKIVWKAVPQTWNHSVKGAPPSSVREHFNRVSALAAQVMEAEGVQGFCFTSRMWPELPFPFPNSLILVGLNPYSVRLALSASEAGVPDEEFRNWGQSFPDFIPSLLARARERHLDFDYLGDLRSVWSSHLLRIGQKIVDLSTMTTKGESLDTDVGFFSWRQYQEIMLEDVTCHNFEVRPTGVLRELYWDMIMIDYEVARRRGVESHPVHGDMFYEAIEALGSQYFLRNFVARLFAGEEGFENFLAES